MKDKIYYVGIDPGVGGAIAILSSSYYRTFPIPITSEGEINRAKAIRIKILLDEEVGEIFTDMIVYIEKVWKPSKLVRIAGILEGIILGTGIDVYRVAPSTWRKEIIGNSHATKEDAINYCLENYPNISLLRTERSRVQDHNLAEALCIAEYAKRKHFVSED